MAHIDDRWYRSVVGPDGRRRREKTKLHGKGLRYRVRYIDPNGNERSKSFPDRMKDDAEAFLIKIENDKREQTYVDPRSGRITFRAYAESWLASWSIDESTRENYESRLRNHLMPFFGGRSLSAIKPETVREWDRKATNVLAASTRAVNFAILQAILNSAIDDQKIARNPCAAKSVTAPTPDQRKVAPWTPGQITAVRSGLNRRYQAIVDVAAGCGLRQGEIFGLAVDDIDADGGWLHIRRQVKRVHCQLVFGLPKNDKERTVPLPASVARVLKAHLDVFESANVTLPWETPEAKEHRTLALVFTSSRPEPKQRDAAYAKHWAINRNAFDPKHWHRALTRAELPVVRSNGMHALRHFYASVLLDAGENIKALSEYLGHHSAGYTLRVYAHLMPGSQNRTRQAIDDLFDGDGPDGLATA